MSCLACATVAASSNRPRSRSISVVPRNLTAFGGAPSPSARTGPRSATYQYSRRASIGSPVPASRASSTAYPSSCSMRSSKRRSTDSRLRAGAGSEATGGERDIRRSSAIAAS